jgi:hypothetical protein
MRGALETLDEDIIIDFLRHAMIVLRGHVREAEVYEAVQDRVRSEATAVAFASTLEKLANVYVATFNPEHERWNGYADSVRRSIEVFNLLNIRPFQPLILAISDRLDPNEAARAFRFLVSLGVRLLVASSTRSGSTEIPLATAAHQVYEGQIDNASKLRAALDSITPTDREFGDAFETARISQARFARYYLRSLEMSAKDEAEPWFMPMNDRSIINLEHVLPQRPEENWPQFSDEEAKVYANRLGNLALMRARENADLKSLSFADKKVVFAQSPYILTSQIAELDDWTPVAIAARQRTLAGLALKTWPI